MDWINVLDCEGIYSGCHSREQITALLVNPEFDKAGKIHDWRNHVLESFKVHWQTLAMEARFTIFAYAQKAADGEQWD